MVAYSFQPDFAAPIESGSKRSTIRPNGKRRHARAGEELQLYIGLRTRSSRLLLRVPCERSVQIEIHAKGVWADGVFKTNSAYYANLARIEGFASFGNLQAWFDRRYGLRVVGFTQITWDPAQALSGAETAEKGAS